MFCMHGVVLQDTARLDIQCGKIGEIFVRYLTVVGGLSALL